MDDGEHARYTGRLPQVAAPDHTIRGRKVQDVPRYFNSFKAMRAKAIP